MTHKMIWLLTVLCMAAALASAAPRTVVTGKIEGYNGGTVTLNYQSYALLSDMQKQELEVAEDGVFRFEVTLDVPTRAFIVFGSTPVEERFTLTKGNGQDTTITTKTNRPEMLFLYLLPKSKQHITATYGAIPSTLKISGKGHADSYYLNEEEWRFNQYRDKNLKNYFAYVQYDESQYLRYVEERAEAREAFLQQYNRRYRLSKHLRHVAKWTIYSDAVMARLLYPTMRNTYREDGYQAPPNYYDFLSEVQLDKSNMDKGIGYFYFLDYYLKQSYKLSGSEADIIDYAATKLSNRSLYEYYAFALGRNFKRKLYEKFGSSSPYPKIAKRVHLKYKDREGMLDGSPAPMVTLQDTSGNSKTFAAYAGRYIYIDFWATWCGPCIQEIPYLQELERDYADKPVVFVSISMDRERDRQKWVDFVRDRGLHGEQVWLDALNNKRISESFYITQIPRFVLLDQEGKIVDANAPRPSDKQVRRLLDKVLENQ